MTVCILDPQNAIGLVGLRMVDVVGGTFAPTMEECKVIIERLARAICARHNGCRPRDAFTDSHWQDFIPGAEEAFLELTKIEYERRNNQPRRQPHEH